MTTIDVAIDALYQKVTGLIPEATTVSISISRQTGCKGAFTMYTIIVQKDGRHIAHASSHYTEAEALKACLRQVEQYRTNIPKACPTCGGFPQGGNNGQI